MDRWVPYVTTFPLGSADGLSFEIPFRMPWERSLVDWFYISHGCRLSALMPSCRIEGPECGSLQAAWDNKPPLNWGGLDWLGRLFDKSETLRGGDQPRSECLGSLGGSTTIASPLLGKSEGRRWASVPDTHLWLFLAEGQRKRSQEYLESNELSVSLERTPPQICLTRKLRWSRIRAR